MVTQSSLHWLLTERRRNRPNCQPCNHFTKTDSRWNVAHEQLTHIVNCKNAIYGLRAGELVGERVRKDNSIFAWFCFFYPYHETSFGWGDGENGRCNVGGGGPTQMPLVAVVVVCPAPTILMIPFVRCCIVGCCCCCCCWCTIEFKSELIRFGELTRIRSGDNVDGVAPLFIWAAPATAAAFAAAIDAADGGNCGWGRSTVGVTGRFVIATPAGGECALIGGELSPPING